VTIKKYLISSSNHFGGAINYHRSFSFYTQILIMSRHPFHRRLLKEYASLSQATLPGISMVENSANLSKFVFRITIDSQLYKDQQFFISIEISPGYPVDSPRVQFILYEDVEVVEDVENAKNPQEVIVVDDEPPRSTVIPLHPHIYSNGHICLNLLGEDWTPACSLESILLSIQSMLSTNEKEERPPDDVDYVKRAPLNPKQTKFVYHDDDV
jgi:ubiquitin-conjugating enzyme E2 W